MTRNLRTQVVDLAEHALRSWHGDDITREDAERYLPGWRFFGGLDDDLRREVLSRFSPAEPPSVPGVDYLPPSSLTDGDAIVERLFGPVPKRPPWSAYGPCARCNVGAGEQCVFTRDFLASGKGSPRQIAHNGRPL